MYFFTALLSFIVKNAAPIAPEFWAPKVNNYQQLNHHSLDECCCCLFSSFTLQCGHTPQGPWL